MLRTERHLRMPTRRGSGGQCRPRRGLLILAAVLLAGCESVDRQEATWLALHAVDVAQTLNAADDPCYQEDAWLTRRLIGDQPSDGQVLAWGAGTAIAHYMIGKALESSGAPSWLQRTWDLTTIANTGYTVVNNHNNGVRPWGANRPVNGC